MPFAEHTTVAPEKTRAEIERLVRQHGAAEFSSGWANNQCGITFCTHGRLVRFVVAIPGIDDPKIIAQAKSKLRYKWYAPTEEQRRAAVEQEERRRWRCMLLAIKAKLEIVESGIATFEEEFLAHIVTDNGETIMQRLSQPMANGRLLLAAADGGAP